MRDVIEIAKQVYGAHTEWNEAQTQRLKEIEALIREDERSRMVALPVKTYSGGKAWHVAPTKDEK